MGAFTDFFQKLFGGQKANIRSLLTAAFKNEMPVRLILPHHDRVTTALVCAIKAMEREHILLECATVLIPDSLCDEMCTLFVKLETDMLPPAFKEQHKVPRTGFMCSSKILRNDADLGRKVSLICVDYPRKYVVRELRRYERVRPTPSCVHTLVLWPQGGMPASLHELGVPQYVTRPQGHPQITLVDISTGGAKIDLHDVTPGMAKRLHANVGTMNFLMSLTPVAKEDPLSVLVNARCLEVTYESRLSTARLRLCFEDQGIMGHDGMLQWAHLRDGVVQITEWIEHDFHILTSKKT